MGRRPTTTPRAAGACSFDPSPDDLLVAAMNGAEYDNAAWCGAYVHVTGPKGAVTVRIVDLCPGCKAGDLDLSRGGLWPDRQPGAGAGGHYLAGGQPGPDGPDCLPL